MSELDLTETQYPLFGIAREDRALQVRARRISGADFDWTRLCWTFPKTRQVQKELQTEFGKEVTVRKKSAAPQKNGVSPAPLPIGGGSSEEQELAARQLENDQLRRQLEERERDIEHIKNEAATAQAEVERLRTQLRELRCQLEERERDVEQVKHAEATVRTEVQELHAQRDDLQLEIAKLRQTSEPDEVFTKKVKEIAAQASGKHEKFNQLLDRLKVDEFLPLRLQEELETALSTFLGFDLGTHELADLIRIVKLRMDLEQRDIDLLYLVRDQRNAAAHPRKIKRTLQARRSCHSMPPQ